MSTARPSFKFRGGSFHALVVKPETPIEAWLADVDVLLARSPGFFAGKSVVIDVSGLSLTKPTFLGLLDELSRRDIPRNSAGAGCVPSTAGFRPWCAAKPTGQMPPQRRRRQFNLLSLRRSARF